MNTMTDRLDFPDNNAPTDANNDRSTFTTSESLRTDALSNQKRNVSDNELRAVLARDTSN